MTDLGVLQYEFHCGRLSAADYHAAVLAYQTAQLSALAAAQAPYLWTPAQYDAYERAYALKMARHTFRRTWAYRTLDPATHGGRSYELVETTRPIPEY